ALLMPLVAWITEHAVEIVNTHRPADPRPDPQGIRG
ncbi:MAG: hypothetical protein V7635_644, partial [Arthrobacter sp.]